MKKAQKAPLPPVRSYKNTKRDGGAFIESIINSYDPDKAFKVGTIANPILAFYKKLTEWKGKKLDVIESAKIIEVNRFGGYRIRKIENTDEMRAALAESKSDVSKKILNKLVESGIRFRPADSFSKKEKNVFAKIAESAKFREDFCVSDNGSNGVGNPFDEFTPIMGGPFSHQQYLHDFLDGLAKSFEAWNHSPYAHQIIRLTTCFVLGRGVSFKAKDDDIQKAFSAWWNDNDMDGRLESWSDMLARDGELGVRRFINPFTKQMFVRWLDPSTIWEIVTDVEDTESVFYYHQQYPAAYQVLYGAPSGAKFDPNKFQSTKYVVNQIPADEVYHVKINVSPNEKRGRSDIFCILGWLKRHKDFQTGAVLKSIVQSVFAWKNKLAGTQTDVAAFIQAFGTEVPDFGSLWTENEASTLEPMVADNTAAGKFEAPGIENTLAVGSGIPKEYLGSSEHSSRSTAVVGSEPGVKKFQARQLLLGRFLKRIAQDWAKNEIASGRIKAIKLTDEGLLPVDTEIEFIFPEIAIEDRSKKILDLGVAKDEKSISHKRMSESIAKELGFHDYVYEDEQDIIAEETVVGLSPIYPDNALLPENPDPNAPPAAAPGAPGAPAAPPEQPKKVGGLGSDEKGQIKANDGH